MDAFISDLDIALAVECLNAQLAEPQAAGFKRYDANCGHGDNFSLANESLFYRPQELANVHDVEAVDEDDCDIDWDGDCTIDDVDTCSRDDLRERLYDLGCTQPKSMPIPTSFRFTERFAAFSSSPDSDTSQVLGLSLQDSLEDNNILGAACIKQETAPTAKRILPPRNRACPRSNKGGAQRTGKGGERMTRAEKLREKNKIAQRRFRERQKATVSELSVTVSDLQNHIDELIAELAVLRSDFASVERHNQVLNRQTRVLRDYITSAGLELPPVGLDLGKYPTGHV